MRDIVRNKYIIILICVTVVIALCSAFYNEEAEKIPFIKNTVGIVIKPIQSVFTYSVNGVGGFFEKFEDVKKLQEENKKLKDEINNLNSELRKYADYKSDNERLQALLELKNNNGNFTYVAANVIARDYSGWYETVTINKGLGDGLKKYDAVVTSDGLVGNITEVGESYAKVLTIVDSTSSVGAEVSRTKDVVMVDGDVNLMSGGNCKLSYASQKAAIIEGDILETSGLGDVYPKGILIGKVSKISSAENEDIIIVEPAVDFGKLSEVLVITEGIAD